MLRILSAVLLGALTGGFSPARAGAQTPVVQAPVAQPSAAQTTPSQATPPAASSSAPAPDAEAPPSDLPALPGPPRGKSTIMGGEIRKVDPVRDVLTLKVYGQKPMKILFDERSQIFKDGKKVPLRDLKVADHASVQTILDGTDVFALSVHVLSKSPEGDYQGHVLSYDPQTTELALSSGMSREPMKLLVPPSTPIVREGQPAFTAGQSGLSDLVKGALITAKFEADKSARGVATQITVLATPGAEFVFIGNITSLDTHTGSMALVDPRDDKSYQISFNASGLPETEKLHIGQNVMVTTNFDGTGYVAKAITLQ